MQECRGTRQALQARCARNVLVGVAVWGEVLAVSIPLWRKAKLLSLGVYPEVSLKEARERRDLARKQVAAGTDQGGEAASGVAQSENYFEVVANEWHEKRPETWKPGHAERVIRSLELEIFPDLGVRPIAEITPMELLQALRRLKRAALRDGGAGAATG